MANQTTFCEYKICKYVRNLFGLSFHPDYLKIEDGKMYGMVYGKPQVEICTSHVDTSFDMINIYTCIKMKVGEDIHFATLTIDESGHRNWTAGAFDEIRL